MGVDVLSDSPRMSVVVPTCGRVPLLFETLDSLRGQTLRDFEVIVTDDSPAEADRAAIERAAREFTDTAGVPAHYLFTKPRLYQAANTNQGLRAARGELIRILHSDDVLRADALAQEAARFARYPEIEVLFEDAVCFSKQVEWQAEPATTLFDPRQYVRQRLSHCTALPSGLVFSRAALAAAGPMHEGLRFLCDWEFFWRLLQTQIRARRPICHLSAGLFGWRVHENSVTGKLWRTHFLEHEAFLTQFSQDPEIERLEIFSGDELKAFLRSGIVYRYQRLMADYLGLAPRDRLRWLPWMTRTMWNRHGWREVKRLYRERKKARQIAAPISAPAANPYGSREENRDALAIAPFADAHVIEAHERILQFSYDNQFNLWPQRARMAAAPRVRLFHINDNRMYDRALHEVLKYARIGQPVDIFLYGNHYLQWFGLKALVDHLFPGQFAISDQAELPQELRRLTFTRTAAAPEHLRGEHSGWTFGLLTLGDDPARAERFIASIERAATEEYEIILIGPRKLAQFEHRRHVRQIQFSERDDRGWITRKKNLICDAARHTDLLICHDRYELTPTFFEDAAASGYSYGLAGPRVVLPDGRRALDWAVASSQNHTWSTGGLLDYRSYSRYVYIPGGATMIRKSFWSRYPWDENLYWNEHEDVELCRRIQRHGEFPALAQATLITHSDRWIDQNPLIPFSPANEVLFGKPVGEQVIEFRPQPQRRAA